MTLLALLHVRTEHDCPEFAVFDAISSKTDFYKKAPNNILFNPNCVIICGPEYGNLVQYDMELAHSSAIMGFPRAQYSLTLQKFCGKWWTESSTKGHHKVMRSGQLSWRVGFAAPITRRSGMLTTTSRVCVT